MNIFDQELRIACESLSDWTVEILCVDCDL